LIDEDFRLWLLEVNNNPDLSLNNPQHSKLITSVIKCTLKITLNPLLEEKTLKGLEGQTPED